jgi:hypothetical protein
VLKCTADPYEMEEQGRTSRASASVASWPSCLEILGGLLVVPFYPRLLPPFSFLF